MYEMYEPMKRFKTRIEVIRKIKENILTPDEAAFHYGFDRSTIYRWLGKWFHHGGYKGLGDLSRKPKYLPLKTDWQLELTIRKLRREKGYCHQRIQLHLKEQGINISPITVYRILKRSDLIKPRKKQPRRSQQTKRPYPIIPGTLIQADTKFLQPRRTLYQYSFLDAASRFAYAVIDRQLSMKASSQALKSLSLPIKVEMIQTDNGLEFQELFQHTARLLGYSTRFNRISSPEENGRVERFHRTIGEEFYSRTSTRDKHVLETKLADYLHYYNYERPHLALDGKSPYKYIKLMSQM